MSFWWDLCLDLLGCPLGLRGDLDRFEDIPWGEFILELCFSTYMIAIFIKDLGLSSETSLTAITFLIYFGVGALSIAFTLSVSKMGQSTTSSIFITIVLSAAVVF